MRNPSMTRLAGGLLALVVGLGMADTAGASVVWTRIDVGARLDNNGRFHVVETHDIQLERSGVKLSRELGMGADQSIVFKGVTRVDPDGSAHPFTEGEVDRPERFRYYPRGHVSLQLPDLGERPRVVLRLEYELVNAVSPAWSIGAGAGPLSYDSPLASPWTRWREVLDDWREAWPDLRRRYRLDHGVLFPSRDGPGYEVRRIDYRFEYDTAWREVHPDAALARVTPDVEYRVRHVLEYLPPGRPLAIAWRPAALRLAALAALPALGLCLWLAFVVTGWLALGGWRPIDRRWIEERLLGQAPDVVRALFAIGARVPTPEELLSRLAGERKLAIEVQPPPEEEETPDVRLRLLVPLASLPAFERDALESLFPDGDETDRRRLETQYSEKGFDPQQTIRSALDHAVRHFRGDSRRPVARAFFVLVVGGGLVLLLRGVVSIDLLPVVLMAHVLLILACVTLWPRGWWHPGQPRRSWLGLLLPVPVLTLGMLAFHLATNRPLGSETWGGTALVGLGCYWIMLSSATLPLKAERRQEFLDLARIRRFAATELRRPRPRLDDRWIPHLEAFDLGGDLERWRGRFGGAGAVPDLSTRDTAEVPSGPRFTGRAAVPFVGPPGWTDALYVPSAEERAEIDELEKEDDC